MCINTVRTLSMDAVQKANSGHPGTPMALAPLAFVLWDRFCDSTREIRIGLDATVSSSPTGTHRCCCIPCFT